MTLKDGEGVIIDRGWTTLGNIYRVQIKRGSRPTQHNIQECDLKMA